MSFYQQEDFLKVSERNTYNRKVNPTVHTGGSISHLEHARHLEEKLGRPVENFELYCHLHTKKHDGVTFIDERVCNFSKRYNEIIEEQMQPEEGSNEPRPVDPDRAFIEAAGGISKGHLYGLGSFGAERFDLRSQKKHKDLTSQENLMLRERLEKTEVALDEVKKEFELSKENHKKQMEESNKNYNTLQV